jgi:hypothetical protein
MDTNDDSKTPSALPGTAGEPANPAATPPASPAEAGAPTVKSRIGLASIVSPTLAPAMIDMAAEAPGLAPKIERPKEGPETAEKPASPKHAAPVSREIIPAVPGHASPKFSKSAQLAAAVVLAAAFGAMAGALGATGVARLAGETAAPQEPAGLQTALTGLRSEVASLKASVDATSRNAGAQYSKLAERFDRVERAQSAASKSDAALPKDTTGSITAPGAAAGPLSPAPVPSPMAVAGWTVRDVYRGVAMLQSRMGGMIEVAAGDVLPTLGRIEAIRRQDGRWVVITSKGMITSMR